MIIQPKTREMENRDWDDDNNEPFFTERDEVCVCEECKKEFKAYDYWENCRYCYDDEDDCRACGGSGELTSVVKRICQVCLYIELSKD